jgi:hypothetical protein
MQQSTEAPIAPARTSAALDFAERLSGVKSSVRLIELAIASALEDANEHDRLAIVLGCRKLEAEIDELADELLPPMPKEEEERVTRILKGGGHEDPGPAQEARLTSCWHHRSILPTAYAVGTCANSLLDTWMISTPIKWFATPEASPSPWNSRNA